MTSQDNGCESRQKIISLVKAATKMRVHSGIFAGMRMVDRQSWGNGEDIGPQLLGVYEQELAPYFERILPRTPAAIVNIGCAEGYYAIGLSRLLPDSQVFAFDTSHTAREICAANADLNDLHARLTLNAICSPDVLAEIAAQYPQFLAILDCEGYELDLLSSEKARASMRYAHMIIETHDIEKQITSTLFPLLSKTHRVSLVRAGGRDPHAFPFLDRCSDSDKWLLICENRPALQRWMVCEPIDLSP